VAVAKAVVGSASESVTAWGTASALGSVQVLAAALVTALAQVSVWASAAAVSGWATASAVGWAPVAESGPAAAVQAELLLRFA
jgi:hypothetical protein